MLHFGASCMFRFATHKSRLSGGATDGGGWTVWAPETNYGPFNLSRGPAICAAESMLFGGVEYDVSRQGNG